MLLPTCLTFSALLLLDQLSTSYWRGDGYQSQQLGRRLLWLVCEVYLWQWLELFSLPSKWLDLNSRANVLCKLLDWRSGSCTSIKRVMISGTMACTLWKLFQLYYLTILHLHYLRGWKAEYSYISFEQGLKGNVINIWIIYIQIYIHTFFFLFIVILLLLTTKA